MASALEERFQSISRQALTEPTALHGFRRRGRVFVRRLDEIAWVIDIQRSRHNTSGQTQFTINCGVYVPRVLSLYVGMPEPRFPASADCCVKARIGMLAEDHLDKWWTLLDQSPSTMDRQIADDIRERLNLHVLPFLESFPTTSEVAQVLELPSLQDGRQVFFYTKVMALGCAGIVRWMRGERIAAQKDFAGAVLAATGTPAEAHLHSLKQRLLSEMLHC